MKNKCMAFTKKERPCPFWASHAKLGPIGSLHLCGIHVKAHPASSFYYVPAVYRGIHVVTDIMKIGLKDLRGWLLYWELRQKRLI